MLAERILYEDNHLVVVDKPAGWPSAHAQDQTLSTVDQLVKAYLREKYQKPGNVYLGVVHRLDRPVSGCLVFAKTSKCAARLSEQFRENAVQKEYWAVCTVKTRPLSPDSGTLEDHLVHDDVARLVRTASPGEPDAKVARLHYHVVASQPPLVLVKLHPQTGRKHQLRVQLASRGLPIYADRKYGCDQALGNSVALHAKSIQFLHPTKKELLSFTAPLPAAWNGRFARLLAGVARDGR